MSTLLVIAKEPRPGRVKTRLTPPFTPREAALLAEAALVDTLRTVAATPASRHVLVLEGAPGRWLPPGFDVVPQCAGGLDERLAAAFAGCEGPTLLIGMDTPQVTPELLTVDFADCDAYFGPAEDGGFWALGLATPTPNCCAAYRCRHRPRVPCSGTASQPRACACASCPLSGTSTRPRTPRRSRQRHPAVGSPRSWPACGR